MHPQVLQHYFHECPDRCEEPGHADNDVLTRLVGLIAICLKSLDSSLANNDGTNDKRAPVATCSVVEGEVKSCSDAISGWRDCLGKNLTTSQVKALLEKKIQDACELHEPLTSSNMTAFLAKATNDSTPLPGGLPSLY